MSIVADQRKKSTTPQSRSNVANQQQTKKNSKQNQPPTQAAPQALKSSTPVQASTDSPKPTSPPPSQAPAKQQQAKDHVSLKGFNADEIDVLLSSGIEPQAEVYKSEHSQPQKTGPWAQKAGTMSNGKDFWFELRRQVAVLQRGESTNKGG